MARRKGKYDPDRLFVSDAFRHFRPRYSLAEVRWGIVVLAVLLGITGWVAWKGAHPDPALFSAGLPQTSDIEVYERPTVKLAESGDVKAADRGPLPAKLATEGWKEGAISQYDGENLYEKINGREGYYKSFGFRRLYFVSLVRNDEKDLSGGTTVDIELYDLGSAANALGAYAGERPQGIKSDFSSGGLGHLDRNALLLTRGQFYLRALGSDESAAVKAQLNFLRETFRKELIGEPLPWAYELFLGQMGLSLSQVSYEPTDAFSFDFARNVYSARLDDGETQVFVTVQPSPAAAKELAQKFRQGFLSYGTVSSTRAGIAWIKDQYIGSFAGAGVYLQWVLGVRGAPDLRSATIAYKRLREGIAVLPKEVKQRAVASQNEALSSEDNENQANSVDSTVTGYDGE